MTPSPRGTGAPMAKKILANVKKWDRITIQGDQSDEDRIVLVAGGKRAYLWITGKDRCVVTLSGPATLRALARAILDEVGDDHA